MLELRRVQFPPEGPGAQLVCDFTRQRVAIEVGRSLPGLKRRDPAPFAGAVVILAAVAGAAGWFAGAPPVCTTIALAPQSSGPPMLTTHSKTVPASAANVSVKRYFFAAVGVFCIVIALVGF